MRQPECGRAQVRAGTAIHANIDIFSRTARTSTAALGTFDPMAMDMHLFDELEPAIQLFYGYIGRPDIQAAEGFDVYLASEALERLEQAQWLLRRVVRLVDERSGAIHRIRAAEAVQSEPEFELRLLTECFYYITARFRSIMRRGAVPGLEALEVVGIRNVRNLLIEHPEGDNSGVLMRSWSFGDPEGPKLKPGRFEHQAQVFQDPGLFLNALELRDALRKLITRYSPEPGG